MKKSQWKKEIHQIFLLTGKNFSDWTKSPRIWMTFALGLVLCLMLTNQILIQAQKYQTSVQMFEPLIWTFGDAQSVMISSLLLLLLFADMPFVNQMTPYWLLRTKRNVWLAGQVLYVVTATCLYTLFLCLTELLIASPWAYVGNVWSQTAASIGYGRNSSLAVPVSVKTMEMTTPYECAVYVVFLMLFYSLFIAAVMLVLNLQKGRSGGLSYRANILCGWLSPLNHATFPMHSFGYDYLPQLWVSILLFFVVISVLILISGKCMKRYNFTFLQVDES